MAKDATLTLRITQELRDALEDAAAKEDRTLSKLAEIILREGVAARSKRKRVA